VRQVTGPPEPTCPEAGSLESLFDVCLVRASRHFGVGWGSWQPLVGPLVRSLQRSAESQTAPQRGPFSRKGEGVLGGGEREKSTGLPLQCRGTEPASQSEAECAWPLAQGPTRADWTRSGGRWPVARARSGILGNPPSCSRSTGPRHELETRPPFPRAVTRVGTPACPARNPEWSPPGHLQPPVWPIPLAERATTQTSVLISSPSSSITHLDQEKGRGKPGVCSGRPGVTPCPMRLQAWDG
jgi:hypothetical protein